MQGLIPHPFLCFLVLLAFPAASPAWQIGLKELLLQGASGQSASWQGEGELPALSSRSTALEASRAGGEAMETSQGRIVAETEQALLYPSTRKCINVRPKCPALSHDSTFKSISNICFLLYSLTCHHPAPTNRSSVILSKALWGNIVTVSRSAVLAWRGKCRQRTAGSVQNSCKKRGLWQLQWRPGANGENGPYREIQETS